MKLIRDRQALQLAGCFLGLSVGYFLTVPLLALYLHVDQGMPSSRIGLILALFTAASQGLQFVVGALASRWGQSRLLIVGTGAAVVGFVSLAWPQLTPSTTVSVVLLGAGNAAITVLGKAAIAATATDRLSAFTLRSVAVNAGSALGPLLGGALFGQFQAALSSVAVLYAALGGYLAFVARNVSTLPSAGPTRIAMKESIKNKYLFRLMISSVGFWFAYSQFSFTFPLQVFKSGGSALTLGLLFGTNAVIVLLGQYLLVMRLSKRVGPTRLLVAGLVFTPCAFLAIALGAAVPLLLIFVVVFSVGEILVVPLLDELTARCAHADALVPAALGFMALGWLLGGTAGNLIGGALYDALPGSYFWLVVCGVGVLPGLLSRPRSPAAQDSM